MKTIKLTQGKFALVDNEDFERVNQFKWYVGFMAKRYWCGMREIRINQKRMTLLMSRFIMDVSYSKIFVDHINHNTLDNRKCNLRICNSAENQRNRVISSNNKSGYKGVSWHKRDQIWQACIRMDKKSIHLGYHNDPELAHKAYCKAAIKYHGKFANF